MAGRLYTYSGYATAYQVQAALVLLAAGLLISARIRTQAVNTPSP
jgi:hypothetical protein